MYVIGESSDEYKR